MIDKNTFCSFPFDTFFLGSDAKIKTCCSAEDVIGDLKKDSIDKIVSSDTAKDIRSHILSNKWHPQCNQCWRLENSGARSERTGILDYNFEKFKKIEEDGLLTNNYFSLTKVDLRWSNVCNLACNYCYEYFSSHWGAIKGIKVNTVEIENEESIFLYIEKNKDTLGNINLLGGEPLLQKQNEKLLKILDQQQVYILTNLAVPMRKNNVFKVLVERGNFDIGVSFETIKDRYEYVRHNASWKTFTDNVDFLRESGIQINAHPLYCNYSAFNLVEYYDYILNEPVFKDVYWCIIDNIDGLNVFKQPNYLKEQAVVEIEKCEESFKGVNSISHLTAIKNRLIQTIDTQIIVADTPNSFVNFNSEIEEKLLTNKKYKFSDLWPDLSGYLTKNAK
jgi:sulfatase maturation enzyme AslB (radical SAM superfamily)